MSDWKPIDTAPLDTDIILYWRHIDHIENGKIFNDGDSEDGIYHVLFDGDSLYEMPSHWMPMMELPE